MQLEVRIINTFVEEQREFWVFLFALVKFISFIWGIPIFLLTRFQWNFA